MIAKTLYFQFSLIFLGLKVFSDIINASISSFSHDVLKKFFFMVVNTLNNKSPVLTPLPNDKILDLSQFHSICGQQNKCNPKIELCFGKGRKQCGKRRKCW